MQDIKVEECLDNLRDSVLVLGLGMEWNWGLWNVVGKTAEGDKFREVNE